MEETKPHFASSQNVHIDEAILTDTMPINKERAMLFSFVM